MDTPVKKPRIKKGSKAIGAITAEIDSLIDEAANIVRDMNKE